jgi:aspartyl/asparaginyl beta-hydroxylase (cupin superfamily)
VTWSRPVWMGKASRWRQRDVSQATRREADATEVGATDKWDGSDLNSA